MWFKIQLISFRYYDAFDSYYQDGDAGDADLILAGITQLITVVLADKIHHHEYIRSLKPLIA